MSDPNPIFFLRGHAKSGTNWLGRLLNLHPRIRCEGEFNFHHVWDGMDRFVNADWHAAHREPTRTVALDWLDRIRVYPAVGLGWRSNKVLLNVGSVGQPRDEDPRAAYALYDTETKQVSIRRVSYDLRATQTKIRAAGLPDVLADRLALGV